MSKTRKRIKAIHSVKNDDGVMNSRIIQKAMISSQTMLPASGLFKALPVAWQVLMPIAKPAMQMIPHTRGVKRDGRKKVSKS